MQDCVGYLPQGEEADKGGGWWRSWKDQEQNMYSVMEGAGHRGLAGDGRDSNILEVIWRAIELLCESSRKQLKVWDTVVNRGRLVEVTTLEGDISHQQLLWSTLSHGEGRHDWGGSRLWWFSWPPPSTPPLLYIDTYRFLEVNFIKCPPDAWDTCCKIIPTQWNHFSCLKCNNTRVSWTIQSPYKPTIHIVQLELSWTLL